MSLYQEKDGCDECSKLIMKTVLVAALAVLATSSAWAESLFNGKDLTGWKVEGAPLWTAKDGVLTGKSNEKKQASLLWTEKSFKDFTFECDFRYEGTPDSGIFLRHKDDQIQLGTSISKKRELTGSIYIGSKGGYLAEAKGIEEILKKGDWNHIKIVAKGNHYLVTINEKQVLDYTSPTAIAEGPIALQVHMNLEMAIDFRNIEVK